MTSYFEPATQPVGCNSGDFSGEVFFFEHAASIQQDGHLKHWELQMCELEVTSKLSTIGEVQKDDL